MVIWAILQVVVVVVSGVLPAVAPPPQSSPNSLGERLAGGCRVAATTGMPMISAPTPEGWQPFVDGNSRRRISDAEGGG